MGLPFYFKGFITQAYSLLYKHHVDTFHRSRVAVLCNNLPIYLTGIFQAKAISGMVHLFFSYAHKDSKRLFPIHARIQVVTEHNLWMDTVGLERGADWEKSIKAAIDDSYGVIFAVTQNFMTRPFILENEIPWAFTRFKDRQGAQLFPILFDDVDLPPLLKTPFTTHVLDARDGDIERLCADLKSILPVPKGGTQHFVMSWPRLSNFKGRDQLLIELHERLIGEGRVGVKTAGLYGTGGIGKTQLAVEYAHRYRYFYPGGVYWLNAAADWSKEIADCALHQDQSLAGKPIDEAVLAFKQFLITQSSEALIILDNVADPRDVARRSVAPKLTIADICALTSTRLLITTRMQALPEGYTAVSVDVLAPLAARDVLLGAWHSGVRADPPNIAALDAIASTLGFLPLALGWVAAALNQSRPLNPSNLLHELQVRGLDDVIRQLQEHRIDLGTPEYHDRLIQPILDWQLEQLNGDAPRNLIALIAAYGEGVIVPSERLRLLAALPTESLFDLFQEAVANLQGYSLIDVLDSGSAFRLHPLTWQYIAHKQNLPALLSATAPRLVAAYRDPSVIDHQTRSRGFSAVINDLVNTNERSNAVLNDLESLLRLFGLEESHLLTLPIGAQDGYIVQQIRDRAFRENDSRLQRSCDEWLANKRHVRHSGLRYPASPALKRTFSGHTGAVKGALQLADGRLLSWAEDNTMRIWSLTGAHVLVNVDEGVKGALQLADGRLLTWGGSLLRFWLPDGAPGPILQSADEIGGALQLADGRILSWGGSVLRLWSLDGTPDCVLPNSNESVFGALQLADARIVSWSGNAIFYWSPNGNLTHQIESPVSRLTGVRRLMDDRLVVWGRSHRADRPTTDIKLSIVERDGKPSIALSGHPHDVDGVLELADGGLLSWGDPRDTNAGFINRWSLRETLRTEVYGTTINYGIDFRYLGYARTVDSVVQLSDGRMLSWEYTHILRVWSIGDRDSRGSLNIVPELILEGHANIVHGALQLADESVLSWSSDGTLRLWSVEKELAKSVGERTYQLTPPDLDRKDRSKRFVSEVTGRHYQLARALQLTDSRILSWGRGHSSGLRIWSIEGVPEVEFLGIDAVQGALQLMDGRILGWGKKSYDITITMWELGGTPRVNLGSMHEMHGALQLADGRLLAWGFLNPSGLRLWQLDGTPVSGYAENRNVNGVLQLADMRLLCWGGDHPATLRIWELDGTLSAVLKGHNYGEVNGAMQLADGRILSWGRDIPAALRIWNLDGTPGPELSGHRSDPLGALQLIDGRILSWSWGSWGMGDIVDSTVRLWSSDGTTGIDLKKYKSRIRGMRRLHDDRVVCWLERERVFQVFQVDDGSEIRFEGHIAPVKHVLQLSNGRLLSWADDSTLRLWDPDGQPYAIWGLQGQIDYCCLMRDAHHIVVGDTLGGTLFLSVNG